MIDNFRLFHLIIYFSVIHGLLFSPRKTAMTVGGLSVICRWRILPRVVVLTVTVCPYFLRRTVLRCLPSAVVAAAVCRRVAPWSHCLAAVSPSRSLPLKPRGDCTAGRVHVLTSSLQALVIVVKVSRWEHLDRVLSAPSPITTDHVHRPRHHHRLKSAWRSVIWSPTFRRLYRDFRIDIPV